MEPTRRSFLGGLLTVAAASCIPIAANAFPNVPRIVGDGIHDDTAGLQAAINGKPFVCEGCLVTVNDNTVNFRSYSRFLVRGPLILPSNATVVGSRFNAPTA